MLARGPGKLFGGSGKLGLGGQLEGPEVNDGLNGQPAGGEHRNVKAKTEIFPVWYHRSSAHLGALPKKYAPPKTRHL